MNRIPKTLLHTLIALLLLAVPFAASAHEPEFTSEFGIERCTFTTVGNNAYFPIWPGYALDYEGEEEDDEGELVDIANTITVLQDTEMVDGVLTRVIEERESEDGELVEISRNFFAVCRETGDVWYFGEDVDDYEDGEIVGHDGEWRAGIDGATAGILMPATPLIGARHFQEVAPGIALDQAEVISLDESLELPAGTFDHLLYVSEGSPLDEGATSDKWYSVGIGMVKDEALELTGITLPDCVPDATTLCLNNGRFEVSVTWKDHQGNEGEGQAQLPSADSGEFWFFSSNNTELIVKVLDACNDPSNAYWVFAAGLTNVEVMITVTDTLTDITKVYPNALGTPFQPVLDTGAFATCP